MSLPVDSEREPGSAWLSLSLTRAILVVMILLGFALRVHNLEGQSMWSDEGLSVYRAALSPAEILANTITIDGVATQDTTPPFYFLLVHAIRATAGDSVFAMRFAGVVAATLAIPLMYVLGSVALGRRVGLIAAILMAISPFHVWQSQVLRNYGLLLTLNLFSMVGLFRYLLTRSGKRRSIWLILWLVASLLGIYTHFFALFIFAFGLLALVIWAASRKGIARLLRTVWFWVAAGLALLVLLPAVALALNRFMAGQQIDFSYVPLPDFLVQAMSAFAVGIHWTLVHEWWLFLPVTLLAIVGLWFAWRQRPLPAALLLGYQFIPLGLLYGLSYINPLYNGVRHLLIGLPPFLILLASGIVGPWQQTGGQRRTKTLRRAWRVAGPVMAVFVIAIQLNWLNKQFTATELVRDDVRRPALYLNENASPDDVIILHDTIIRLTFEYYYNGRAPVVSIPLLDETDGEAAIRSLQSAGEDADRVWFLKEPRPRTGFSRTALSDWARDNWPRFHNAQYEWMWLNVVLEGYLPDAVVATVPDDATNAGVSWDQTLRLHGFDIPGELTAGEGSWLTFYLSQPGSLPEQHTLSLRLVDEMGQVWAQMDKPIEMGFPPAAGMVDTLMRYDHQVTVPPGTPPGQYSLLARLVRTADGYTVPVSGGEIEVSLTGITVDGSACSAAAGDIPADTLLEKTFGAEIQLVGHNQPAAEVRAGDPLSLALWWCARQQPGADYRLRLQLVDDAGHVVGESIGPLTREEYPTTLWQEDELLMGLPQLTIPGIVEAGLYDLKLSLLAPDSDQALRIGWPLGERSVTLGQVEVTSWPMETELPAIENPLRAGLGQPAFIELYGYDLSTGESPDGQLSPGQELGLTLVWRSVTGQQPTGYKVFVHLLDDAGEIVTQSDGLPAGGLRPTTSWREGEVIIDEHALMIPVESVPGEVTLWVGLYDPETGQRPPLIVDGQEQPDSRLKITSLSLQP